MPRHARRSVDAVAVASLVSLLLTAACGVVLDIQDVPDPDDGGGATSDASRQADGSSGDGSVATDSSVDGAPPASDGSIPLDGGPADPETVIDAPAGTALFGAAIAFAASSGTNQLVAVGAPGTPTVAGSVTTYVLGWLEGSVTAQIGHTFTAGFSAPDGGVGTFGTAVAFGNSMAGRLPMAVGSPTSSGGIVTIEPIDGMSGNPSAVAFLIEAPPSAVNFGSAVAFDADGDLYVGAPSGPGPAAPAGVVYVYAANSWMRATGNGASVGGGADLFGASLASEHGGGVLVGAPASGGAGTAYLLAEGSVTSLVDTGAAPVQQQASSELGQAVALSSDGSHALLGAPGSQQAYLVDVSASAVTWGQTSTPISPSSDMTMSLAANFGRSVAIASDQLAVGSSGGVLVYGLSSNRTHVLSSTVPSFGSSLAYTTIGGSDVLAVGAPVYPSSPLASGGAVHLFVSTTP